MIIAADNLSAARPSIARAIKERDAGLISGVCQTAQQNGATWLDLNPGYLRPEARAETWRFLVETVEAACGLTLLLDAPEPDSLAQALEFCTRPPILNMATAESARLEAMLELAQTHNLALVASTMTATVPQTLDERLALAAQIAARASAYGVEGERLILDPMVMPLALESGESHAAAVLAFLRAAPHVFDPKPLTMIAISNLTTSTAGKETKFAAAPFLAAAFGAGLDVAMMDATDQSLLQVTRLAGVFNGERIFAPGEFSS